MVSNKHHTDRLHARVLQKSASIVKSSSSKTLISVHPGIMSFSGSNTAAIFTRCSRYSGTYGNRNTGWHSPHIAMAVFMGIGLGSVNR